MDVVRDAAAQPVTALPELARRGGVHLIREHAGLLAQKSLRGAEPLAEVEVDFEFDGSAPREHRLLESTTDGLRVGVAAHEPAVWEGFFAMSRTAYPVTSVFHVEMTRDEAGVPRSDQSGEAVFAV